MKILRWIGILFALIGLGLLGGAYFAYHHTSQFLASAVTAQGTVIDLARSGQTGSGTGTTSSTYRPVVSFEDHNGEPVEFISTLGSNPPSYRKGDQVGVLYLEDDPQDAVINSFMSLWFVAVLLGAMGTVFLLVGLGLTVPTFIRRRSHERLRQTGTPVHTKLKQVTQNTAYRSGGRHPYQIITQWQNPRTGRIHVFASENVWFDPSDYLPGDDLTVYIDPDNPDKYYLDVSFLPKLAE
jgi:hypothetical protein